MSGLVDDKMKQHVMKTNVLKDDFGWEVPVESIPLPSNGLVYSPDSLLHGKSTLQIKAMTAQEEDIIMSQAYAKEGTTILYLIKSCLIDKNIDVKELIVGDRNALMISIRITGYGSKYDIIPKCINCDTTNDMSISLTDLPIKRLNIQPLEPGSNKFLYKLPVTGKSVIFKYMNAYDEQNRQAKIEFMKKTGMQSNTIVSLLEEVVISVDGVTDKNKISQFVRNMPALDSKSLREYIAENQPGIDMDHKYTCKNCGHVNSITIPITSNFFWP